MKDVTGKRHWRAYSPFLRVGCSFEDMNVFKVILIRKIKKEKI